MISVRSLASKYLLSLTPLFSILVLSCTQEIQNKVSRSIQNWTGTDGVLDVISDGKVMYRFIKIDKISTAQATGDRETTRPYRYGYGVLDVNQNFTQDENERKIYFEFSDFSTSYVFYENPGQGK
jgi:hypothetical protein